MALPSPPSRSPDGCQQGTLAEIVQNSEGESDNENHADTPARVDIRLLLLFFRLAHTCTLTPTSTLPLIYVALNPTKAEQELQSQTRAVVGFFITAAIRNPIELQVTSRSAGLNFWFCLKHEHE